MLIGNSYYFFKMDDMEIPLNYNFSAANIFILFIFLVKYRTKR